MEYMHEADYEQEAFDTLSLADLHIYSDPSSSSQEEEDNNSIGSSFSSFRFTLAGPLPSEELAFFRNLISLPKSDPNPYQKTLIKPSKVKTASPVQDIIGLGGKVVRPRRRSGFLMFGLGGSTGRMDVYDLRRTQARATPPRVVPINNNTNNNKSGVEKVTMHRKSGGGLGKLLGACINPTV